MNNFAKIVMAAILSLLASCGAGSSGGGAASGTTQVTIPFASSDTSTVAGGALAARTQTAVPAAVQSIKVTAKSGTTVLQSASATRPSLTVSMTMANATAVTFLVQAFDIYGSQIYEGLSAAKALAGKPVTVGVTEKVVLGGVAATGLAVANGSITITDANGVTVPAATTDISGNYRVVLPTNLAYPLLLQSTLPNGVVIASMMTRLGKVHTNTLSTLVVAKTLGVASYSQIQTGFTNKVVTAYTNATVPVSQFDRDMDRSAKQVMQQLGLTRFTKLGKVDPLHDANFVADGTGLDGVMDSVRMEERDLNNDGTPDLVLAGRGGAGIPILSVRSGSSGLTREGGTLALSGATIAGDTLSNGVALTASDTIAMDSYGGANKITTTISPATLGLSNQALNHFVSAVTEGFDQAGVAISDPYNQGVVRALMNQLLQGFQTIQAAGGVVPVDENSLDRLGGTIGQSLAGKVSGGKVSSTYNIAGLVQTLVQASVPNGGSGSGGATAGGGTTTTVAVANSYARATAARIPVVLNSPFTIGSNGITSVSSDVLSKVSPLIPVQADRSLDQQNFAGGFFEAISMLPNGLEGWVVGQRGIVQHTTDGGVTWAKQAIPLNLSNGGALIDVKAVDATHVWAVGGENISSNAPLILFYNGSAWSQITVPTGVKQKLMGVAMVSATQGYVVAASGEVLTLTNGAWSVLSTVSSPYANPNGTASMPVHLNSIAVDPTNTQSLWVLSDQGVYHSTDGGATWGVELTAGKWTNPQTNTVANYPVGGRTLSVYGTTIVAGDWNGSIVSSQDGGVTWRYQPNIGSKFLRPQMIDAQLGFAVDAEVTDINRVFKTIDGGISWTPVTIVGGLQWATNLDFIDRYTGWVVGQNELITKIDLHPSVNATVDQHNLVGGVFESIAMLPNQQEGWAVGLRGLIRHTTDGGTTWVNQTLPLDLSNGGALIDIYAVDVSHVWAVGRKDIYSQLPIILFYNGSAWQQQSIPASVKGALPDVVMLNATSGYAVADSGEVLQFAGGTWSVLTTVISPYGNFTAPATSGSVNLNSIAVDPTNTASLWVFSDQGIYHSSDGGSTWGKELTVGQSIFSTSNQPFSGRTISVYGSTVVAGGWNGDLITSNDGGVTWSSKINFGNPGYPRPQMFDRYSGVVLIAEDPTSSGWMLSTTDGGHTWNNLVDSGVGSMTAYQFFDLYTGWVVGANEQIYKVDLHKSSVATMQNGMGKNSRLISISMLPNGLEGWAVGFPDQMLHTSDGGISWQQSAHPAALYLWDVKAVDANHVWVLGDVDAYGTPLLLTYDGTGWSKVALPSASSLRYISGIAMVDSYTGYVVGDRYSTTQQGVVLKTTDGRNWIQVGTIPSVYTNDIAVDPNNPQSVWVVGDGVYHSNDGGSHWSGELTAGRYTVNGSLVSQRFPAISISVRGNTIVIGDWGQNSVSYANNATTTGSGILSSQDGGVSWHYTPKIGGGALMPQMLDASRGFALDRWWQGSGDIYRTQNGGVTWQPVSSVGGVNQVESFNFIDAYTGWVVGANNLITKITLSALAKTDSATAAIVASVTGGSGDIALAGTITNATTPLQSGKLYALLYSEDWAHPLAMVPADSYGAFIFPSVAIGNYNVAAVLDTNGSIDRYGVIDQSVDFIGEYPANPVAVRALKSNLTIFQQSALQTDLNNLRNLNISITGLSNRYYFSPGTTTITWTAQDANGATVATTTQSVVVGVTKQSWDTLRSSGDTVAAASQFSATLANDPTNIEAAIGLCVTNFANLMTDPGLLPLLKLMTSDNGATLPSSATLAMSIANKSKLATVNWLSKMAITGTQVQSGAFVPVIHQISNCIVKMSAVLGAGFVSQSISNPSSILGGSTAVQIDVDDIKLLLAQMYALRSQIYWLDAYNWDTDVDGDNVKDALQTSFTDSSGVTYQYRTISVDPYAVFNDPTFFTKRASGTFTGSGAQNLVAALSDAQQAASRAKAVMVNFSANSTRGLDGKHLFSFVKSSSLAQGLTDATNADNALNGTGYSGNFSRPSGVALAGTVRADLFYPVFDRSMLPQLEYDVPPDPLASKKNNTPTIYDDGAGNNVSSSIYFGNYPDPTVGGAFIAGAALNKREQKTRPASSVMLNVGGVPIRNYQYSDTTGFHNIFWPGGVMGNRTNSTLHAVQVNENRTLNTTDYTVYTVDTVTGALTANLSGTLSGKVNQQGSGAFVGSVARLPGSSGSQSGFWSLMSGSASLVPVAVPTSVSNFFFTGALRSSGSATGLVHWYQGDFTNSIYFTLQSVTSGGTASIRERYPLGSWEYSATPLGTDSTLGWLVFEPGLRRLNAVTLATTPTSSRTYYAPFWTSFWSGHFHLLNGQMVDAGSFPVVSFYPLPAASAFPAATTANVKP